MADAAARDPRVRLLRLDANVGLPAALNHGFAAARGALHSWTSDDNLLRPAMLARLVSELAARPPADIVHFGFILSHDAGESNRPLPARPGERVSQGHPFGAFLLFPPS